MPIKAERRARILKRAGNCCEWCGVKNYAIGAWSSIDNWIDVEDIQVISNTCALFGVFDLADGEQPKVIKIVLTIAHLDHNEENLYVKDERLAALCQRCHLQYDSPEKARRRAVKKYEKTLFPLIL